MWSALKGWGLLIFLLSVLFGIVASAVIFVVVARLPVDHFLEDKKPKPRRHPVLHTIWFCFKNTLGAVLFIAGIIMVITPGPGFLSIFIGISLLDLPQKHELMLLGLKRQSVRKSLNWIRKKTGTPPLKFPARCEPADDQRVQS